MSRTATTHARQQAAAITNVASGVLQRKCACGTHTIAGGECASCQKGKTSATLRRAATNVQPVNEVPPIMHEVLRSPGQPLDSDTRNFFEHRFNHDLSGVHAQSDSSSSMSGEMSVSRPSGPDEQQAERVADQLTDRRGVNAGPSRLISDHNFSGVRIHIGSLASSSARSVNALAFTVGRDIVFADGQYAPQSASGRRLLAHELTHVWQNRGRLNATQVQRFESPEHQDLGGKYLEELFRYIQTEEGQKWAKARGLDPLKLVKQIDEDIALKGKKIKVRGDLELTPSEIIALMGDFYGTWQELQGAPKQEIDDLLKTMAKERKGGFNANVEYENITKGRYTKLARVNTAHFAPKNREEWKRLHVEAIAKAKKAGADKDENAFQEALLMDAAGGHFLTDAFAAGHLFDTIKVQVAIQSHLKSNPISPQNPEMQTVVSGLEMLNLAPPLVLKNIHDRMNSEGFEITNPKGMHWKTFGDNYLKNAQETQRIAALAVFISRQQISQAKKGESPDIKEIVELLPDDKTIERATDQAFAYIPTAVKEVVPLIHRNVGMLSTLKPKWYLGGPVGPYIGKSILGTISDPHRIKELEDYDRRKMLDSSTPYPTAPLIRIEFP